MSLEAKRHAVYSCLLYDGLHLDESHARQVAKVWYGIKDPETSFEFDGKRWAATDYLRVWFDGVRSIPSEARKLIVTASLAERFDLEGVAGFYHDGEAWRLNLRANEGALLARYRNKGLISGILVYRHLNDKEPKLLTSRGLPRGTKAEPYYPERAA